MKKGNPFPREYYKTAIEAYEKIRKIIDYGKETAHLKRIFGWLESINCLSVEHIQALIKAHRQLVYDSGDKFWSEVPFCPTGLSYNMFNRLIQKVEQKQKENDDYQKALEESYKD